MHLRAFAFPRPRIVAQIRIVAERRAALERARTDLLAASKEKKIVEKLKERRREAIRAEEMRMEQKRARRRKCPPARASASRRYAVIVTRQRRKPFPWRRLILPVVAIGLVVFAFVWPPSRNVILNGGPLSPMLQNRRVALRYDCGSRFISPRKIKSSPIATGRSRNSNHRSPACKRKAPLKTSRFHRSTADRSTTEPGRKCAQLRDRAKRSAGCRGCAKQSRNGHCRRRHRRRSSNATPEMRRTAQVWANDAAGKRRKGRCSDCRFRMSPKSCADVAR